MGWAFWNKHREHVWQHTEAEIQQVLRADARHTIPSLCQRARGEQVGKYLKVILHRNIYKQSHNLTFSAATLFFHTYLNQPALTRCPLDSFTLGILAIFKIDPFFTFNKDSQITCVGMVRCGCPDRKIGPHMSHLRFFFFPPSL